MKNLRRLELAIALEQHRHFGRAAAALHLTQPALSRGIASLEADLGIRLFDRTSRRVEPTPAGRVLVAHARRLLADAEGLRDSLGEFLGLRSGHLRVGVGPYPLDLSVTECVARLAARHPELQVEVAEGEWREFGPKLLSGEVEVAVMDRAIVSMDSRFRVEALPAHAGCLYCRDGHPLAGRRGLGLADVLAYPLVGVRIPVRVLPVPLPASSGLLPDPVTGDLLPRITTTSFAAARAIVKRTDGVGMAIPVQIAEEVRTGGLAILDAPAKTIQTNYGITTLRDRTLSPAAQAFVDLLKEVEAELEGGSASARRPATTRPRRRGRIVRGRPASV